MADKSVAKPFYSVLILAFFCSLMVAGAAVGLRPLQQENKLLDQKKNILLAAGLYEPGKSVSELFKNIDTRIFEIDTGKFVSPDTINPDQYNQLKAAMSSDLGKQLPKSKDVAGIRRLEKYSFVYLVKKDNALSQIILPIRGKGLWSTLYGYLAIDGDLTTVRGISFYQHGETPGLGGEIENPRWQAGWKNKKIYNKADKEVLHVGKPRPQEEAIHHVDGVSGATLTTAGVDHIIDFWFGENGYKPFIEQLKKNGGING